MKAKPENQVNTESKSKKHCLKLNKYLLLQDYNKTTTIWVNRVILNNLLILLDVHCNVFWRVIPRFMDA